MKIEVDVSFDKDKEQRESFSQISNNSSRSHHDPPI